MKEAQHEEQDKEQEMEIDLIRKKIQYPEEVSQSWSEWNTGQSRGVSKLVRVEDWAEQRCGFLEEVKSLQKCLESKVNVCVKEKKESCCIITKIVFDLGYC